MQDHDFNFQSVEFNPFAGPEIEKIIPAIEPQTEIWLACMLGGDDANRAYNESVSLRLNGLLNIPVLESALHQVALKHESLRSVFSADGQSMLVFNDFPPTFTVEDISQSSAELQKKTIEDFHHHDSCTAFDLINGPLIRVHLFKLSDNSFHLTITAHHIICDGWSMALVMQDLGKHYTAFQHGQTIPASPDPDFADYAAHLDEFSRSDEFRQVEQFWLDQFSGSIPETILPTDQKRPAVRTYKARRDDFRLAPALSKGLRDTGAKSGCTFITTLIASFEILLHHHTGLNDLVLGIPAAGQSAEGFGNIVGHCVNMLPLRSHIDTVQTFNEYLIQRKPAILDAYEHQQFTFGTLIRKLGLTRDASKIPLIPIIFNVDLGMDEGVDFDGLPYKLFINKRKFENFELFLNVSGAVEDLTLEWSYNTGLFQADTIRQFMADFEHLISRIIHEPELSIVDLLPVLKKNTTDDIYHSLNDTEKNYTESPVVSLIEATVLDYAEKTALIFENKEFSYAELNRSANILANQLIADGLKSGERVAVAVERGPVMVYSLLAVLKAGGTYVPVDPDYPAKRIRFMVEDSGAKRVLVSTENSGKFGAEIREIVADAKEGNTTNPNLTIDPGQTAYIIYTSGSTGQPKGTPISHRSLTNLLCSLRDKPGIDQKARMLAITTIAFDIAAVEIFLPLISGATTIIASSETVRDGKMLYDLFRAAHINVMQATPSTWRMMIDAGFNEKVDLKIFSGGEAMTPDLAAKLLYLGTETWNMYGPTETAIYSIIKKIEQPEDCISIGRPVANTKVYIVDEKLNLLPPGEQGEIAIGGAGLSTGYINRPELSDVKFPANPFAAGQKLYLSGDLGYVSPEGEIIYQGRRDHQVKIRGHRIELGAIEHTLNQIDDVRESVVTVREDRANDQRLVAYVVPANFETLSGGTNDDYLTLDPAQYASWKQSLQDILPSFMIPATFVAARNLPRLPNSKTDRSALPAPEQYTRQNSGKKPGNQTQVLVARIWAEVLGKEDISLDDDFFDLGGHSLSAVQVIARLESETGKRVAFTALFRAPTLEEFSALFSVNG